VSGPRYGAAAVSDVRPVDDLEASFLAGEPDALRQAYDAHGPLVYTLCARSLGRELAGDVTQDVFAAGWLARGSYDPSRGSLAGWLVGIARNKIVDQLRRNGRRPASEPLPPTDLPQVPTVEVVDSLADRLLLADAMSQLAGRARQLIELSFYEDLSHHEIADRCNLPLGTVKSDIRRGLSRMRRHLERAK